MKNTDESAPCGTLDQLCGGRREFLTRSVAGGLAIVLGGATLIARADDGNDEGDKDETAANSKINADEVLIKPSDFPQLAEVGGFVTLNTTVGKIVVARVEAAKFVAVGAVCTHKGGPIEYDKQNQQFYCPWHKSQFDLEGAVLKGPAKQPLPHYKEETATVIKLG